MNNSRSIAKRNLALLTDSEGCEWCVVGVLQTGELLVVSKGGVPGTYKVGGVVTPFPNNSQITANGRSMVARDDALWERIPFPVAAAPAISALENGARVHFFACPVCAAGGRLKLPEMYDSLSVCGWKVKCSVCETEVTLRSAGGIL